PFDRVEAIVRVVDDHAPLAFRRVPAADVAHDDRVAALRKPAGLALDARLVVRRTRKQCRVPRRRPRLGLRAIDVEGEPDAVAGREGHVAFDLDGGQLLRVLRTRTRGAGAGERAGDGYDQ